MTKPLPCHSFQFHSALLVMMCQNENIVFRKQIQAYFGVLMITSVIASAIFIFFPFQSNSFDVSHEALTTAKIPYAQTEWVTELPVRLVIPAISVDAKVQYIGITLSGTGGVDVPSHVTDVGWYQHGVRPGMQGNAVIAGYFNGDATPEAVFYNLHTLRVGDEVVIMSAERIEDIFYVVKIETYDYGTPVTEVFLSDDRKARLNLITYNREWSPEEKWYNKRTVVFTESLTSME